MASVVGGGMTMEERRRRRELDEARKSGLVPPEKDAEGNLINPHIPEFMSKAPWYVAQDGPSLEHQKSSRQKEGGDWDERHDPYKDEDAAVAMWRRDVVLRHERLDQEREKVREAKRLAAEAERRERKEQRRRRRQDAAAGAAAREEGAGGTTGAAGGAGDAAAESSSTSSSSDSDSDSELADVKEQDAHATVHTDIHQGRLKQTVRNLRAREDTAKYLINLDPESAHYDPRTHSMREDPNPATRDATAYHGDNAYRTMGARNEVEAIQRFAWEAHNAGHDVEAHANPTEIALRRRQFEERRRQLKEAREREIRERYGETAQAQAPPGPAAGLEESEVYVEYGPDGRPHAGGAGGAGAGGRLAASAVGSAGAQTPSARKPGAALSGLVPGATAVPSSLADLLARASAPAPPAGVASRYPEDIHEHGHTHVWGSWFDRESGRWGYACCRSTARAGRCTGVAGLMAYAAKRRAREAPAPVPTEAGAGGEEGAGAEAEVEEPERRPTLTEELEAAIREGRAPKTGRASTLQRSTEHWGDLDESAVGDSGGMDAVVAGATALRSGGRVAAVDEPRRRAILRRQAELMAQDQDEDGGGERDERKLDYVSGKGDDLRVSEADIEAWRQRRRRAEDPMSAVPAGGGGGGGSGGGGGGDDDDNADAALDAEFEALERERAAQGRVMQSRKRVRGEAGAGDGEPGGGDGGDDDDDDDDDAGSSGSDDRGRHERRRRHRSRHDDKSSRHHHRRSSRHGHHESDSDDDSHRGRSGSHRRHHRRRSSSHRRHRR